MSKYKIGYILKCELPKTPYETEYSFYTVYITTQEQADSLNQIKKQNETISIATK